MTPTHELRLQTMLRAMTEVVIPALPPGERLAMDQAQTVVGYLRILADQCGRSMQYAMVELREYAGLVDALQAAARGEDETCARAAEARAALEATGDLAGRSVPTEAEIDAHVQMLKSAADSLLRAAYRDGAPDFRARANALVFEQSERQLTRERVWFRRAGFELDPGALPQMDEVLR